MSELLYSPATYGIDLSAKDMIKPRARWGLRGAASFIWLLAPWALLFVMYCNLARE
jgi:hypothetical protein